MADGLPLPDLIFPDLVHAILDGSGDAMREITRRLNAARDAAVAEEREACAQVARSAAAVAHSMALEGQAVSAAVTAEQISDEIAARG